MSTTEQEKKSTQLTPAETMALMRVLGKMPYLPAIHVGHRNLTSVEQVVDLLDKFGDYLREVAATHSKNDAAMMEHRAKMRAAGSLLADLLKAVSE